MPYNPIAIQIGSLFSLAPKKGQPNRQLHD